MTAAEEVRIAPSEQLLNLLHSGIQAAELGLIALPNEDREIFTESWRELHRRGVINVQ